MVDDAVTIFTRELLRLAKRHVPSRMVSSRTSSHPWLTQRCANAVHEKMKEVGATMAEAKRDARARVLRREFDLYVQKQMVNLSDGAFIEALVVTFQFFAPKA